VISANVSTGAVSEQLKDQDKAAVAFDHALRHNPHSVMALTAAAGIARARDQFDKVGSRGKL
jgi:glucose repression mediator protein